MDTIRLKTLFSPTQVLATDGDPETPVTSICTDSRRVSRGAVFFAMSGTRTDGHHYIEEAIDRGAAAIVSELPGRHHCNAAWVRVRDVRKALADAARRYHGNPQRELGIVGVTGTNGKTTVTYLTKYLLEKAGNVRSGLLGTVQYDLGERTLPAHRTTPDSAELYAMLGQMRDAGCRRVAMEVSSHGIDQHRVDGIPFTVACFTNLTQDHLDYHGDMETYFGVKARLFSGNAGSEPPKNAVINVDDPYGRRLMAVIPRGTPVLTYGIERYADFKAEDVRLGPSGVEFRLVYPGGTAAVRSVLPGLYNVSNLLAAIANASVLGVDPAAAAAALEGFRGVPGRMERVSGSDGFAIFVDYAHTDDALRNALGMLRGITRSRLIVVFGCGGNRDRNKRPLMVKAVQEFADYSIATADNPRHEALEQIFADMRSGVDPAKADRIGFVESRRRAIGLAIDACREGDVLLIAGKGHETYQEIQGTVHPFDDRSVARELLEIKRLARGGQMGK